MAAATIATAPRTRAEVIALAEAATAQYPQYRGDRREQLAAKRS